MTKPSIKRVATISRIANSYLHRQRVKVAGEVIFKKDTGGDANSWAFGMHGPSQRVQIEGFIYNPKDLKPISHVLRSTTMALGHALSAYNDFSKLKTSKVSPDGNLGGRGYIMEVKNIRRQLTNVVEALSTISDTLYDEIHAPHWEIAGSVPEDTKVIVDNIEEIREDPEEWARDQESEAAPSKKPPKAPKQKTETV